MIATQNGVGDRILWNCYADMNIDLLLILDAVMALGLLLPVSNSLQN
jgi:hypothetical protein